jgi:hypothetical protein
MADKRISQLIERTDIANNDVLPIVASGATTTNKVTISTIQDWMQDNLDVGVTSVGITFGTSGTDINASGSPVTSSGNITINLPTASATNRGALSSADWITFNSKQPAGNYVTLDTAQTITAQKTFTTSGSSDTMIISHGSGSGFALDVIKAGNNEAIRVTKTSGSGNAMTISGGNFEAPAIVKTGGTSSEFLKADGSVDSNSYVTLNTTQTISGTKTFTTLNYTTFTNNDFFQAEFSNGSSKLNLGSASNIGHIASNGDLRFNTNYPTDALGSPKLTIASNGQATFSVDAVINGVKIGRGSGNGANLRVGEETLNTNTTGIFNTAIGTNALRNNTTGQSNTSTGYTALQLNTTGGQNTANGYAALQNNTTGSQNTAVGVVSLRDNTTGNQNTAVGILTLSENTTGNSNSAVGYGALTKNSTGFANAAIGLESLSQNTTGYQNTATGVQSLNDNTIGNNNTAIGNRSAYKNTDGDENTAIGLNSLYSNTTGNQNTAVGFNSGALTNSGASNETSSNSVYIGQDARSSASGNTNEIVIGSAGRGNGSNTVTLGNDSITNTYLKGAVTLTGALNGTSATFSSSVGIGGATNTLGFLEVHKSGSSIAQFSIGQNSTYHTDFFVDATGNFYLQPQGNTALTLASTGAATFSSNVVSINGNGLTEFKINNNTSEWELYMPSGSTDLRFYRGTDKVTFLANGNVGIGTDSPGQRLDVNGKIRVTDDLILAQTNPVIAYDNGTTGALRFASDNGNAEKMRITSGGYLKASSNGVYNDAAGSYHEMRQTGSSQNIVVFRNGGSDPYGVDVGYPSSSPNNTVNNFIYCFDSTAQRFSVRSNGGIANYSANDVNLSDERTKKDIEPLESYWDKFKAIEIVKFKYIDQTHDDFNIGVIAQQVESVAPEFVDVDGWNTKPELDEEGNEIVSEEEPLKSIYTADLHHATIKVLQEAMAKIEKLEIEIDSLKNQIK